MENKDKEYAQERQEGKNWAEKATIPRGGLERNLAKPEENMPEMKKAVRKETYQEKRTHYNPYDYAFPWNRNSVNGGHD